MTNELAKNIASYRKRSKLTQEELANKLNISFQAISKWENAQSMPDISILGDLAAALDTDIDSLMGYPYSRKRISYYEDKYGGDDYYWGLVPSDMCFEVMKLVPPDKRRRVLDIGCGEGRNAVFFARNGYQVDAFDIADSGVEKTKRLAERCGTYVHAFKANLLDYRLETEYDIVFSTGVLHYIPEDARHEILSDYRQHTVADGLHALNVFVRKPFIGASPENESNACLWRTGELAGYYADWLVHDMSEIIFDCLSSGIPHKHCIDRIVARRVV